MLLKTHFISLAFCISYDLYPFYSKLFFVGKYMCFEIYTDRVVMLHNELHQFYAIMNVLTEGSGTHRSV